MGTELPLGSMGPKDSSMKKKLKPPPEQISEYDLAVRGEAIM